MRLAGPGDLAGGSRLNLIVCEERFRRQGFARLVLRYALELAWAQRCCKVMLLSGAERTEARSAT